MSLNSAARPALRPSRMPAVPTISRAPETNAAPSRLGAAWATVSILGIVVIASCQLLLTIAASDTAYQLGALRTEQKELTRTADVLRQDLDAVKSPQFLAANAEALGMVRNSNPVYLRLSDGAVLGSPSPAAAGAGKVMGPSGNQVPNVLLNNRPLVAEPPAPPGPAGPAPAAH